MSDPARRAFKLLAVAVVLTGIATLVARLTPSTAPNAVEFWVFAATISTIPATLAAGLLGWALRLRSRATLAVGVLFWVFLPAAAAQGQLGQPDLLVGVNVLLLAVMVGLVLVAAINTLARLAVRAVDRARTSRGQPTVEDALQLRLEGLRPLTMWALTFGLVGLVLVVTGLFVDTAPADLPSGWQGVIARRFLDLWEALEDSGIALLTGALILYAQDHAATTDKPQVPVAGPDELRVAPATNASSEAPQGSHGESNDKARLATVAPLGTAAGIALTAAARVATERDVRRRRPER